mmetsp:Transcript_11260/g.27602  ORF Transcript_11260/g.27602 Transcript_11260/m.27602 type:complete len:274 (+) Transcript_11260:1672-2493(+)
MYCVVVSWHLSYSSTTNLMCCASVRTMMACRCCATSTSSGSAKCWRGGPRCSASSSRRAPRAQALRDLSLSRMSTSAVSASPPSVPSSCSADMSLVTLMPVMVSTSSLSTSRSNESAPRSALARNWHSAAISTSGYLRHTAPVNLARDCSQSLMLMPSSLTLSRSMLRRVRMTKVRVSKPRGVRYLRASTTGSIWLGYASISCTMVSSTGSALVAAILDSIRPCGLHASLRSRLSGALCSRLSTLRVSYTASLEAAVRKGDLSVSSRKSAYSL